MKGAWYYYRIAANIVWLVLVGWALAMGHLMAAIFSVRAHQQLVFLQPRLGWTRPGTDAHARTVHSEAAH